MDGKGSTYATVEEKQLIPPYLDKDIFFRERWITAEYVPGSPSTVSYSCAPPASWNVTDRERVEFYFSKLNLKERFSHEAAPSIQEFEASSAQCISMGMGESEIFKIVVEPVLNRALPPNHWKAVLYEEFKRYLAAKVLPT